MTKEDAHMENERLCSVLASLNEEFDKRAVDWLISMYDAKSGGTYYSASSRDGDEFEPDIESTTQAVTLALSLGLMERGEDGIVIVPEWYRDGVVSFLTSRQDENDGYFYDPIYKEIGRKDKKERNTAFAMTCLKNLGTKALYPTPMERIAKAETRAAENIGSDQAMYATKESFLKWLDENAIARKNSYCWGSDISSAGSMIRASGHYKTTVEWLRARQYKENGSWEPEFSLTAINGVLKISNYFGKDEEFPNYDVYIQNLVEFMKSFNPSSAAEAWNPLGSLNRILAGLPGKPSPSIKQLIDGAAVDMIESTLAKMREFRQPDGGFGYKRSGSSRVSNGVVVSLGLAEGDVNALALMSLIYREAYTLSGVKNPEIWRKYRDYFWEEMKKKHDEAKG